MNHNLFAAPRDLERGTVTMANLLASLDLPRPTVEAIAAIVGFRARIRPSTHTTLG